MNRTDIEWCDFTWNPVTGCSRHCKNCFAHAIHNRRHKAYLDGKDVPEQYAKPFSEFQFFYERLKEPIHRKKPAIIFVVDMGDLFDDNVPKHWIQQVIGVAGCCPQHIFMFLTKNPKRYQEFEFTDNCWLGTSITGEADMKRLAGWPLSNTNCKKFVSLEPITGPANKISFYEFDLVIVGAMTGINPDPVSRDWFNGLRIDNIFFKENIRRQVTGLPPGSKDQIRNPHLYRKVFEL